MSKKLKISQPKQNKKLEKVLNLTDFSASDDVECLSEDGLWVLASHVSLITQLGWNFVDCYRDEKKPGKVHLLYEKMGEE